MHLPQKYEFDVTGVGHVYFRSFALAMRVEADSEYTAKTDEFFMAIAIGFLPIRFQFS